MASTGSSTSRRAPGRRDRRHLTGNRCGGTWRSSPAPGAFRSADFSGMLKRVRRSKSGRGGKTGQGRIDDEEAERERRGIFRAHRVRAAQEDREGEAAETGGGREKKASGPSLT